MRKTINALTLAASALFVAHANAGTVSIPAGSTTAQIRSILNSSVGSTVQFTAETYPITATINVPSGSVITGPVATPATAILAPTFTNQPIFNLIDPTSISIQHINFTKTQSIKFKLHTGTWCANGCLVAHNQFTSLTAQHRRYGVVPAESLRRVQRPSVRGAA